MATQTIFIPEFHEFNVPKGSTVESAKADLLMSEHCYTTLTSSSFGTLCSSKPIEGSFLSMGRSYVSEDAMARVAELVRQRACTKIRLGNVLELLLYKRQGLPHPRLVVSLAATFSEKVLRLSGSTDTFTLINRNSWFPAHAMIFIVKES